MNVILIIQIVDENKDEDEYDPDKFYLKFNIENQMILEQTSK